VVPLFSDLTYKRLLNPMRPDQEEAYMILYDYEGITYWFRIILTEEIRTQFVGKLEDIIAIHADAHVRSRIEELEKET